MTEQIEKGEYVRTEYGYILENTIAEHAGIVKAIQGGTNTTFGEIVKHNKNKLELIEKGDYLNGEKVLEIARDEETKYYRIRILIYKDVEREIWRTLEKCAISTITTKEQFEEAERDF